MSGCPSLGLAMEDEANVPANSRAGFVDNAEEEHDDCVEVANTGRYVRCVDGRGKGQSAGCAGMEAAMVRIRDEVLATQNVTGYVQGLYQRQMLIS